MHKQTIMEHTKMHKLVCDDKVPVCAVMGKIMGEKNHSLAFSCFIFLNKKWDYYKDTSWMCASELQF